MDKYFSRLKERIQRSVFVSDVLWAELQAQGTIIHVKKNEILVNQSSKQRNIFYIASGSFMHSLVSETGYSQAVWFFFDETFDFTTCLDSYFLNKPTKYTITAMEDSVVIKYSKQAMDNLIKNYPAYNEFFISHITLDLVILNEYRAYSLVNGPLDTMKYLEENCPEVSRRVSSKNMAHFLGISPEWYSKLKKKLDTK